MWLLAPEQNHPPPFYKKHWVEDRVQKMPGKAHRTIYPLPTWKAWITYKSTCLQTCLVCSISDIVDTFCGFYSTLYVSKRHKIRRTKIILPVLELGIWVIFCFNFGRAGKSIGDASSLSGLWEEYGLNRFPTNKI